MSIKLKLTIVSFLQLFVWGAWLTTLASYGFGFKQWSGAEFGIVFSTLGAKIRAICLLHQLVGICLKLCFISCILL
jgi:hypothetical protein